MHVINEPGTEPRSYPKPFGALVAVGLVSICASAGLAPGARSASPAEFAYIGARGQMMLAAADGSGNRQLNTPTDFRQRSRVHFFTWSPDGSRLAIWRGGTIYVVDADGSHLHAVAVGSWPAWSPNGRRIAFVRWLFGAGRLSIVNANGRHMHRLVPGESVFTHVPETTPLVWAPGRRIVFEGAGKDEGLWVTDPNRATKHRLAPTQRWNFWATPSPDHVHVAYVSPTDGTNTLPIYVTSTTGGTPQQVTKGFVDLIPSWSPDGDALVFTRRGIDGTLRDDVFVVDANGTNLRRLTKGGGATFPSWSPDGTTILFTHRTKCVGAGGVSIDSVKVTGGPVKQLACGMWAQWRPRP